MESMLLLVVLFAIMYFMMIRPENKRKKKIETMRANLRKGDIVTTIGGVIGKVVAVDDEKIVLETSEDRVRVEFAKWAIQNVEMSVNNEAAAETAEKKGLFSKKKAESEVVAVPEEPEEAAETTEEQ